MKKILLLIISAILLVGCTKPQEEKLEIKEEKEELTDDEKALLIINECINDYNTGDIDELQEYWNTTIPPKPINIGEIEPITSLKDLKEGTKTYRSKYSYIYDLGDYQMIIDLHAPLLYFWQDGNVEFDINLDTVQINNPDFSKEKRILDELFRSSDDILHLLYGVGVDIERDYTVDDYYLFSGYNGVRYKSIDEIKAFAETTFSSEYLAQLYAVAFESESPIYKDLGGLLMCTEPNTNVYEGLQYDTSTIIATNYHDNYLDIDLLVTIGGETINHVYRITLIDEGNGYRFTNSY